MSFTFPSAPVFIIKVILMLFNAGFTGKNPGFPSFYLNAVEYFILLLTKRTVFSFQNKRLTC